MLCRGFLICWKSETEPGVRRSRPLASGGYPWTVIRVKDRDLAALDRASVDLEIEPFARFTAEHVRWSMEEAKY